MYYNVNKAVNVIFNPSPFTPNRKYPFGLFYICINVDISTTCNLKQAIKIHILINTENGMFSLSVHLASKHYIIILCLKHILLDFISCGLCLLSTKSAQAPKSIFRQNKSTQEPLPDFVSCQ